MGILWRVRHIALGGSISVYSFAPPKTGHGNDRVWKMESHEAGFLSPTLLGNPFRIPPMLCGTVILILSREKL